VCAFYSCSTSDWTAFYPILFPASDWTAFYPILFPASDWTAFYPILFPASDWTAFYPIIFPASDWTAFYPILVPASDWTAFYPIIFPQSDWTAFYPILFSSQYPVLSSTSITFEPPTHSIQQTRLAQDCLHHRQRRNNRQTYKSMSRMARAVVFAVGWVKYKLQYVQEAFMLSWKTEYIAACRNSGKLGSSKDGCVVHDTRNIFNPTAKNWWNRSENIIY
jgi:hypothetical protein